MINRRTTKELPNPNPSKVGDDFLELLKLKLFDYAGVHR
jgi:hypothetical protein